MAGGAVVGFWVSPTPWQSWLGWFSLAAPASASAPETAAPNSPQLAPGSREEARRGHGPGHCAAGVPCRGRA